MAIAEALISPPVSLRDHRWRWRDLIIGLVPLILFDVLTSIDRGGIRNSFPAWSWIPLAILPMAWLLAWPLWAAHRLPSLPRIKNILVEAGWALLALPVIMVTQFGLLVVLPKLLGSQEATNPFDPVGRAPERYHRIALAILAVVVAPLAEETFFRGMLYNALRQRIPFILAALISGAAFGLMHPFGPLERINIAAVGFLLALLYEWRKTLLSPILLHGVVNVLGMAMFSYSAANTPMLGVRGDSAEKGCVLTEVVPGGSAEEAGLQVGDVITHAGENSVRDQRDLTWILKTKRIGEKLPVWYNRRNEAGYVEVLLKGRPGS